MPAYATSIFEGDSLFFKNFSKKKCANFSDFNICMSIELEKKYAATLEFVCTKSDGEKWCAPCPEHKNTTGVSVCKCNRGDHYCKACDLAWFWCKKHSHWVVAKNSTLGGQHAQCPYALVEKQ
jgi:hypothetical protein